jgi:hypothetical protein
LNTIKLVAAVAVATSALLCIAPSQAAPPQAPPVAMTPDGLAGPNLSPDQQKKAIARKQKMYADFVALQKNKTLTNAQKQAKFMALQKQFQSDMLAILTPAQRAELLRRQSFANQRMEQIVALQTKLQKSITPSQLKQIGDIRTADAAIYKQIVGDKPTGAPTSEQRTKIAALVQSEKDKINGVLNPQQRSDFAKLQDLMPAPPMH